MGRPDATSFSAIFGLWIRPINPLIPQRRRSGSDTPVAIAGHVFLADEVAAKTVGSRQRHFRVVAREEKHPRAVQLGVTGDALQQAAVVAGEGDHQQGDAGRFTHGYFSDQ